MVINENMEKIVREKCDVLVCSGGIAGVAAAVALSTDLTALKISALQKKLRESGVYLHEKDL